MGATENIELAKRAYEAIAAADIPWIEQHTSADVVFHQGGRFPTAGVYRGRDAMLGHFFEFMTMVEGRFSIEPVDFLASADRVAAVIRVKIGLGADELEFEEVHLWRIADGQMVEMHAIPFDPYAIDAFFAAHAAADAH